MPRKKKPRIARLDQVKISRKGEEAIINSPDKLGPEEVRTYLLQLI